MKVLLTNIQRIAHGEMPQFCITSETPFEEDLLKQMAYGSMHNNGTKAELYCNWSIEGLGIQVGVSSEELEKFQKYDAGG